jgi:predicted RNA-binding protein (TIGR00451 family)
VDIRFLDNREVREFSNLIMAKWGLSVKPRRVLLLDRGKLYLDDLMIVRNERGVFPFLGDLELLRSFPRVSVDMGAIKSIINGAKVMRPGIRGMPPGLAKGTIVIVSDEKFGKGISVGTLIDSSDALLAMKGGAAIFNEHYIGDRFWKAAERLAPDVLRSRGGAGNGT